MGVKSRKIFFLFAILILAAFFRFYKLEMFPPGLYPDIAVNGNNAIEALETRKFRVFYPENNGREGLFINLEAISIAIFGNTPFSLRIISSIFGFLTVFGMYLLGQSFSKNSTIGLLASFFMAVSFWHINFSRSGFRVISAPFFLVFGFYFLYIAYDLLKRGLAEDKKSISIYFIISGIFFGLGFYTYIGYRFIAVLLPVFLFILLNQIEQEKRRRFLIYIFYQFLAIIITALPLGIYFLNHPADFFGRAIEVSVFRATGINTLKNIIKTLAMFNFIGDWNWRHNYAGAPLLSPLLGIPFIIGFIILSIQCYKTKFRNPLFSFPLLSFFIMLAANFLSYEGSPHALRALVASPFVFLINAIGAEWIWKKFLKKMMGLNIIVHHILIAILISGFIFAAWYEYFVRWARHPETANAFSENYVKQAQILAEFEPKVHKYVITNGGGIDVRGFPSSSQTLIYLLGGWNTKRWKIENVYLIRENEFDSLIPQKPAILFLMQESDEWKEKIYLKFPTSREHKYKEVTIFYL